ncbi:50-kDa virion protein [Pseudomonas phage Pf3]|uniref:50-kDa virion protein n=1 Tax=Pseudomonas phage Pf3 TaxID=10872 RepID=UPI000016D76C|nr:50-kDa virion protein [Pseudomonas phage Pf3]AAA88388.1 50-kDa virion protein [Pseudomonas phage Pf3]
MGLHYLFGFCLALFSFSAIAAGPVSTEVAAGTTTYRVTNTTVRTPPNVTLSPVRDITPYVEKIPNKGLAQAAQGRLIVAQRAASVPVTGFFNVSGAVVKSGAKSFLRSAGRASGIGLGLAALLEAADWVFDEEGEIVKPLPGGGSPVLMPRPVILNEYTVTGSAGQWSISKEYEPDPRSVPGWYSYNGNPVWVSAVEDVGFTWRYWYFADVLMDGQGRPNYLVAYSDSGPNEYWQDVGGYSLDSLPTEPEFVPLTDAELEAGIDQYYEPDPDDWRNLFPYIEPDSFTIETPIPSLDLSPVVSSSTNNQTGKVTVTETTTSVDFEVSDNNSSQPSISVNETTTENVYVDGDLVSSETNTTVTNPPSSGTSTPPSSGSGSDFQLPSFCSWATAVCDWFDWTQEPIDEEPDLSGIISDIDDFERTKDISFGSKSCPAPIALDIEFLDMSVDLSFEWFCELAGIIYFMVMASAYVLAAYITLGVVRG